MDRDEQINILLTKGVEQVLPSVEFLKAKLKGNERLKVYCGFDPTAPTLHIGHAIALRKLRQFQELGHEIIFLIGDFTARIGDPTDKLAARTQLSEREIKTNLKLYKQQASKFIRFTGKNAAKIKFNNKWLGRLKFADVISLASNVTVDQMLKRDMFARRTAEEKPIFLHEFLYPLMQGYDSVALGVDGEVGGNDQLFNMMVGRTLLKQIKGREKFVITMKLLQDSTGKKMGKTEGNMISLLDTPEDIYGKVMSWTDGLIIPGFELCTDMHTKDTKVLMGAITHPKKQKEKLAFEIVKSVHSEKEALRAAQQFAQTFEDGKAPDDILILEKKETLKETFLSSDMVASAAELRRLTQEGALTELSTGRVITVEELQSKPKEGVYKIGKRRFGKIL